LVVARAAASLAAATLMGWVWLWLGPTAWPRGRVRGLAKPSSSRWRTLRSSVVHDFGHTGGFLVLASLGVAVLHVAAPVGGLTAVASHRALSVGVLAVLAVVLAVCSEADAFVAASLTSFSSTARLAFLVVGPMVDVKLIALQAATFGSRFALRFAPATFVVAVASAVAVGTWLL
jgi:uncharacterized membrane protein YraQ (UPF0718 family)